jgi:hypothetical protein
MQCASSPGPLDISIFFRWLTATANSLRVNPDFAAAHARPGAPAMAKNQLQIKFNTWARPRILQCLAHGSKTVFPGQ